MCRLEAGCMVNLNIGFNFQFKTRKISRDFLQTRKTPTTYVRIGGFIVVSPK